VSPWEEPHKGVKPAAKICECLGGSKDPEGQILEPKTQRSIRAIKLHWRGKTAWNVCSSEGLGADDHRNGAKGSLKKKRSLIWGLVKTQKPGQPHERVLTAWGVKHDRGNILGIWDLIFKSPHKKHCDLLQKDKRIAVYVKIEGLFKIPSNEATQ